MKLIGMLDSPYVRRIAITLTWLEEEFEHEAISVFADMARFSAINPLIKAPSFICDDGTVLMDSPLILQYVESQSRSDKVIAKQAPELQRHYFRVLGLAQIAADKCVQYFYETQMRPQETRFPAWEKRIVKQINVAFSELDKALQGPSGNGLNQASIAAVTALNFHEDKKQGVLDQHLPTLNPLMEQFEAMDLFKAFPPIAPAVMEIK